jgi:NADP-dependent 3-hydroxy acid dehydrogenase YdfG
MPTNGDGSVAGKVAFVTGAANGIGRAAALAFAREGASVVVTDVLEQDNQETARMIEEDGGRALAIRCDVTRAEDVKAALDKTIETFGRLDAAFNNAGVEQATMATADITEEEWDRIVAINLRGVFVCMKYEIPLMLTHGGGAIVNTSSGAGVKGFAGQAAYAAAKHGVVGLSKAAALDFGRPDRPGRGALGRPGPHRCALRHGAGAGRGYPGGGPGLGLGGGAPPDRGYGRRGHGGRLVRRQGWSISWGSHGRRRGHQAGTACRYAS